MTFSLVMLSLVFIVGLSMGIGLGIHLGYIHGYRQGVLTLPS